MSGRPALPPGPFLVVGLKRSGLAAARVLAAHGEVIGLDSSPLVLDPEPEFDAHTGADGVSLLERVNTVVKSPGVPWAVPVIEAAVQRGIEVTGELELAWRLLPENRFVAVTGTNGKTTTVELLGAIWRAAGLPAEVVGNVGRPVADLVGAVDPSATIICEASSFQLEDSSAFAPDCAVLLNLEDDHLDRHGTARAYAEAKARIFANQTSDQVAVVPADLLELVSGHARTVIFDAAGVPAAAGEVRLRGAHNLENAAAAAAAAAAMGIGSDAIATALRTFAGVPNRLEEVARVGDVLFVNDSKATNPASAVKGIEAFDGGVHVILGGSLKGGDFLALREAVASRCRAAYLIGEAEEGLAADLEGTAHLRRSHTLEQAVAEASEVARPGEVVLLSPACASFDSFDDYEHRGRRFRELVPAPE